MSGDRSPVVVEGVLQRLSPTALDKGDPNTYGGCERKWWYRYVQRLPEPQGAAQILGEKVHSELEHYLKTSENVLGSVASAGRVYLPKPGPGLLVETSIAPGECVVEGVPFIGRIDLAHRNPLPEFPLAQAHLRDHKTTSTIDYKKEVDSVLKSTQSILYTHALSNRAEFSGVGVWSSGHIYYQTRGALRAHELAGYLSAEEIAQGVEKKKPIVRALVQVAREVDPQKVATQPAHCRAYKRPCPYLRECGTNPVRGFFGPAAKPGEKSNMAISLSDRLKAIQSPTPPPAQAEATATQAPAAAATPTLFAGHTEGEGLEVRICTAFDATGAPIWLYPLKAQAEAAAKAEVAAKAAAAPLPSIAEVKAAPAQVLSLDAQPTGNALTSAKDVPTVQAAVQAVLGTTPAAVTPPTKRSPGRPKKLTIDDKAPEAVAHSTIPGVTIEPSKMVQGAPKVETSMVLVTLAPANADTTSTTSAPVTTASKGLQLYVNAIPGPAVTFRRLEPYIALAEETLRTGLKLADVRMAPKDSALAFGGWKGALAALVREQPPEAGAYVVLVRNNELAQVVVDALGGICAPGFPVVGVQQ